MAGAAGIARGSEAAGDAGGAAQGRLELVDGLGIGELGQLLDIDAGVGVALIGIGVGVAVEIAAVEDRAGGPEEARAGGVPDGALRPEDLPRALQRRLQRHPGAADEEAAGAGAVLARVASEIAQRRVGLAAAAGAAIDDLEDFGFYEGGLRSGLRLPAHGEASFPPGASGP